MYDIDKLPLIILSTPRSGSTLVAHELRESLEQKGTIVRVFNEPINSHEKFDFLKINDKKYILKFHAGDIKKYPKNVSDLIYNQNCFLVRIRRKNIEDQIVSNYIAQLKKKWGYYKDYTTEKHIEYAMEPVDININDIKNTILHIKKYNEILDNFSVNFNLDLCYEDIEFRSTHLIKTPLPKNFNLIKQTVRGLVNNGN